MDTTKKIILIALAIIILMAIFPPLQRSYYSYELLFGGGREIDLPRLIIQWVLVGSFAGALIIGGGTDFVDKKIKKIQNIKKLKAQTKLIIPHVIISLGVYILE